MIKIKNAEVYITEQTVKELTKAIEKARNEVEFTTDAMSEKRYITKVDYIGEKKKRGEIRVRSEYCNIEFVIQIEEGPNKNQESLGYQLV
jgi:hypothetical protein